MTANTSMDTRRRDAAILVQLLQPAHWIPRPHAAWVPVVTGLLRSFFQHFDGNTLSRLVSHQRRLPSSTAPAARAAALASEFTALHKVCQILARHPALPEEARASLVPLERLPAGAIPDERLADAAACIGGILPGLSPAAHNPKIGRGSVADVFRFQTKTPRAKSFAFKIVREDALQRIRREAAILSRMANEADGIGAAVSTGFIPTLSEALRDASRALLREIDFAAEARNLRQARALYSITNSVIVPEVAGEPIERGLLMEFLPGTPILEVPMDEKARRLAAGLLFRSIILEPLFSGLPEAIFHADPHAGNLLARTHKDGSLGLVLLDWSQAARLCLRERNALVRICLAAIAGVPPSRHSIELLLQRVPESTPLEFPANGDPLHRVFDFIERLAVSGAAIPLDLLLLRKSFLTLEGVAHHLDPGFSAWRQTMEFSACVFASELPFRVSSIPFPWLDKPGFYRTGISTRTLLSGLARTASNYVVRLHKNILTTPPHSCYFSKRARAAFPARSRSQTS